MLKRHAEPRVSIRRVPYNKHATGPGASSRRLDLTRVESPLNWPAGLLVGGAGNSADGTPLASAGPVQTQKMLTKQVTKVTATQVDLDIQQLNPSSPAYMAHSDAGGH